jgi:hypothetical protein
MSDWHEERISPGRLVKNERNFFVVIPTGPGERVRPHALPCRMRL